MDIIYIIAGLVLLFFGGEALIRGSVMVSEKLGISPVLIGVVIVGFGTSTPELLVSVQAVLAGSPEIALGNAVGSNIANIMLILAVAGIITPLACHDPAIRRDALLVIAASLALMAAIPLGAVSALHGGLMLLGLCGYIVYSYKQDVAEKQASPEAACGLHEREAQDIHSSSTSLPMAAVYTVGGIIALIIGARLLVDGATSVARAYGVSEAVIGLSLVAVGTSLPELAAGVVGAIKRQTDMVVGNILGSNMYNILGILGIASLLDPLPVQGRMASMDMPVMLGVACLLAAIIYAFKRFGRMAGIACLALYVGYIGWMFMSGATA